MGMLSKMLPVMLALFMLVHLDASPASATSPAFLLNTLLPNITGSAISPSFVLDTRLSGITGSGVSNAFPLDTRDIYKTVREGISPSFVLDTRSGSDPPSGAIEVTLEPPDAVAAGARWRRVGTMSWLSSGQTESELSVGTYMIEFKSVTGWTTPASELAAVTADQTTQVTATYQTGGAGSVSMVLEPVEARTAGARWRRTGTAAWLASGETDSGLPPGAYTIEFKGVTGWITPTAHFVTVVAGQTTEVTGTYHLAGTGSVSMVLEPEGARTAGAQWRAADGDWLDSGATQAGISPGSCTVEFQNISGWGSPGDMPVTVLEGQTVGDTVTYSGVDPGQAVIKGVVSESDGQGGARGWIVGATVSLSGGGSTTTGSAGDFQFTGLTPGAYTVTASKTDYLSVSQPDVAVQQGESRHQDFYLPIAPTGNGIPVGLDFTSPRGRYFVSNTPGAVPFGITVSWHGSPGAVRFLVNGVWHDAEVTPPDDGLSRATVNVQIPPFIIACSELMVEMTNGEGRKRVFNSGVQFLPLPRMVVPWYCDDIPWTPSGLALTYGAETSWSFPPLGGGPVSLVLSGGYKTFAKFDLLAGSFSGSLNLVGRLGFECDLQQWVLHAGGQMAVGGHLEIASTECYTPESTAGWQGSLSGRFGAEAPVASLIPLVFPPAGPLINGLLEIPGVGCIVGGQRFGLYVLPGLQLSGNYPAFEVGDCWLGAASIDCTGKVGIEGQATAKLFGAKAGAYVGGEGQPVFELCPEFNGLQSITFHAYIGAFAEMWGCKYKREIGADLTFGGLKAAVNDAVPLGDGSGKEGWTFIGDYPLRWGPMNRLPLPEPLEAKSSSEPAVVGAVEETVVENVTGSASPSLLVDETEMRILFVSHSPEKPPYAATDIAEAIRTGADRWASSLNTDDTQSEFEVQAARVGANQVLAAWVRITGDTSEIEDPTELGPYLDVAASWWDAGTGTWSASVALTNNAVCDRSPMPVVMGSQAGVLWIQNEGGALLGSGTEGEGDRLMYAPWTGSDWGAAQTLWSDAKGNLGIAFVSDSGNEGHVVFVVDEDGDLETGTDRELYWIKTISGVWGTPVRLTSDEYEDFLPVLTVPNEDPLCVWRRNGEIVYSLINDWNPRVAYEQVAVGGDAPTLDGVTLPGGAAIAYAAESENGHGVFAAFYDAALDQWSLPRQLTINDHAATSLSLDWDGRELVIAYLKTLTERNTVEFELGGETVVLENVPQPGRTDLCVLRYALEHDFTVQAGSVETIPANPAPGEAALVQAVIENTGDLAAQDIRVVVYGGDPALDAELIGETVIARPLAPGAVEELSIPWTVPTDPDPYNLHVVVDPDLDFDDRNRDDNTASVWTVLPDLAVETCWASGVDDSNVTLVTQIANHGVIPTGACEVVWRDGGAEGPVIGQVTVESIVADGMRDVTYLWNRGKAGTVEFESVYVEIDTGGTVRETDEMNNTYWQTVGIIPSQTTAGWLRVTMEPSDPAIENARWKIQGDETWFANGALISLPPADYTVEFEDITGWVKPVDQLVTITEGNITELNETYDRRPTADMWSPASDPTNVGLIVVFVVFSEPVVDFTDTDLIVANGVASDFVADGMYGAFNLTPTGEGLVTADIAADVVTDLDGNGNEAAVQFSRVYDSVRPTVAMTSGASEPTSVSPIPVTATFNEPVIGFTDTDIVVGNGTVGNLVDVGGGVYTFDLTPLGGGLVTADIAADVATDLASNGNDEAGQFSRTFVAFTITQQPVGGSAYVGDSFIFMMAASGGVPPLNYQWTMNWEDIPDATSTAYELGSVTLLDAGFYACYVTDALSAIVMSNDAMLQVAEHIAIATHPVSQTVPEHWYATFTVVISGGIGPISYQWQRDDEDLTDASQSSYTINPVLIGHAGSYTCIVTDEYDAANPIVSNEAILTVDTETTVPVAGGLALAAAVLAAGLGVLRLRRRTR